MKKLHVTIEFAENNLAAYLNEVDGIIGIGCTIDEVKDSLEKSIKYCIEDCAEDGIEVPEPLAGEYELVYAYDMKSFLNVYCNILSKAGLEKLTGINQKQLWHYASGKSKPRKETVEKVSKAVHGFARELLNMEFV